MKQKPAASILSESEQQRLNGIRVRVIEGEEITRAREYLERFHYLQAQVLKPELRAVEAKVIPRWNKGSKQIESCTSSSTIARFFNRIRPGEFAKALSEIETQIRGDIPLDKELVVCDGKKPAHGDGSSILTAVCVPSQHHLGSCLVEDKTNEIPVLQQKAPEWGLEGGKISVDALHTQHKTARVIVQEMGADYLMTVKGNQEKLQNKIKDLFNAASKEAVFSPYPKTI